jgi:hypothetical protein
MTDIKNLDFNEIKQNLLSFLKTQSKFSGYNFEGSALNTLVDILAYNTYYQSFYNNMTFSEMFLDSATKRTSVVSLAKMLGYTPTSAKSSICVVELTTDVITDDTLFIASGKTIKTIKNNEATEFVILEDVYLKPFEYNDAGAVTSITTGPINVYEGKLKTLSFIHDSGLPFRQYVIEYNNVDISTLKVKVQENSTSTKGIDDTWERVTDITKVGEDTKCYFVEENPYGYYVIYFGDGVVGKRLEDGNMITVSVIQTNGEVANGIGLANPSNTFRTDGYNVNVLIPSFGGAAKETKESIKSKAPKSFTAQERAVTAEDYKNILYKDFPNLKSVSTWGGEENDPPEYGKIYISVETQDGIFLSTEEKSTIANNLIKNRAVVGITPIIIDPEVIYLQLNAYIKSDLSKLNITKNSLQTNIQKKIQSYIEENLGYFDGDFYSNELITTIDAIDQSIVGITITPTIEKRINVDIYNPENYTIYFRNQLSNFDGCYNAITSSSFYYFDNVNNTYRICQLEDDKSGLVNIIYLDVNNNKIVFKEIGSIDYDKGIVKLQNFAPTSLIGTSKLRIYAAPNLKDIYSQKNNLIFVDKLDDKSVQLNIEYIPYRNKS